MACRVRQIGRKQVQAGRCMPGKKGSHEGPGQRRGAGAAQDASGHARTLPKLHSPGMITMSISGSPGTGLPVAASRSAQQKWVISASSCGRGEAAGAGGWPGSTSGTLHESPGGRCCKARRIGLRTFPCLTDLNQTLARVCAELAVG